MTGNANTKLEHLDSIEKQQDVFILNLLIRICDNHKAIRNAGCIQLLLLIHPKLARVYDKIH